jgi:hypothetical protein
MMQYYKETYILYIFSCFMYSVSLTCVGVSFGRVIVGVSFDRVIVVKNKVVWVAIIPLMVIAMIIFIRH